MKEQMQTELGKVTVNEVPITISNPRKTTEVIETNQINETQEVIKNE